MTKPLPIVNVGVDVSKETLDVHLLARDLSLSVPNHETAIASLIARLKIVTALNAMLRDNKPWQSSFA